MFDFVGWVGALALAICGLPQAILSYKQGHSRGISWGFIGLWWVGEVITFGYVLGLYGVNLASLPLLFNYFFNIFLVSVILNFKICERED